MPRFFASMPPDSDGFINITDDDARHIALSLRYAAGDMIDVCRDGVVYGCRIVSVRPELVTLSVVSSRDDDAEMMCRVTLYAANPKGGKLDGVIQKATELGAAAIAPFLSERCVSRPAEDSRGKRHAREARIAYEAAKQCGRGVIPEVREMTDFKSAVADAASADLALFIYEKEEERTLKDAISGKLRRGMTVSVMTGAEGGFSPAEAKAAVAAGMIPCSLGRRILRCETAPVYVLSAISYEAEL